MGCFSYNFRLADQNPEQESTVTLERRKTFIRPSANSSAAALVHDVGSRP
jgi:hypothetical protein